MGIKILKEYSEGKKTQNIMWKYDYLTQSLADQRIWNKMKVD